MASAATLRFSSGVLRVLIVLNILCLFLFAGMVVFSYVAEPRLSELMIRDRGIHEPMVALRSAMALGIVAVWPAHLLLTRLSQVVSSAGAGAAFSLANAGRLKTIAWATLALQLLDLAFGWLSYRFEDVPAWSPGVTGWIAVLLLFVLAQVFEQGAAMRDELDATV